MNLKDINQTGKGAFQPPGDFFKKFPEEIMQQIEATPENMILRHLRNFAPLAIAAGLFIAVWFVNRHKEPETGLTDMLVEDEQFMISEEELISYLKEVECAEEHQAIINYLLENEVSDEDLVEVLLSNS
jgi:hypothetical protein